MVVCHTPSTYELSTRISTRLIQRKRAPIRCNIYAKDGIAAAGMESSVGVSSCFTTKNPLLIVPEGIFSVMVARTGFEPVLPA